MRLAGGRVRHGRPRERAAASCRRRWSTPACSAGRMSRACSRARPPRSAGSTATTRRSTVGSPANLTLFDPAAPARLRRRAPARQERQLAVPRPRAARPGRRDRPRRRADRARRRAARPRRRWRPVDDKLIPALVVDRADRRRRRLLMALGWRARRTPPGRRSRRARGPPAELGERRSPRTCSTSRPRAPSSRSSGSPWRGLGFRAARRRDASPAAASCSTWRAASPAFIPAAALRGVGRATWTIDRVVDDGRPRLRALGCSAAPTSTATSARPIPTALRRRHRDDRPRTRSHRLGRSRRMTSTDPAVLVLEDGTRYAGRAYGARGRTLGEAVFATGMTGYQETLTDPSYAGQIVVMTAPHIGNTGMNDEDPESRRIWVVRLRRARPLARRLQLPRDSAASTTTSSHERRRRHQRHRHPRRHPAPARRRRDARRRLLRPGCRAQPPTSSSRSCAAAPEMAGPQPLGRGLGRPTTTVTPAARRAARHPRGARPRASSSRRSTTSPTAASTCTCCRRTSRSSSCSRSSRSPSSTRTAPATPRPPTTTSRCCAACSTQGLPFFGICFGNQLLGRALGLGTYKLPFGHRGINQPVLDKATGRVEITATTTASRSTRRSRASSTARTASAASRSATSASTTTSSRACNALDIPAFSVQYHPEAAAGPHDANYLFDRFAELVRAHRAAPQSESN